MLEKNIYNETIGNKRTILIFVDKITLNLKAFKNTDIVYKKNDIKIEINDIPLKALGTSLGSILDKSKYANKIPMMDDKTYF